MWAIFNNTLSVDSVWSNIKFWPKLLTIWCRHDVIWTLWCRHESIATYTSKFADISRKFWLDGIKYCYKNLFHYFLMSGNVVFTFICCLDVAILKILTRKCCRQETICWQSMTFKYFWKLDKWVYSVQNSKFLALLV